MRQLILYRYASKYVSTIVFCFVSVLSGQLFSQTYVSPYLGTALNSISQRDINYIAYPVLTNSKEESYSFGITIDHRINTKFLFNLHVQVERLSLATENSQVSVFLDREIITPLGDQVVRSYIHERFSFGLGANFHLFENVSISLSQHAINTPYIIWHESILSDIKNPRIPSNEWEIGSQLGLNYLFNNFRVTAYYYYGFWHNERGAFAEIDPVRSFGLRIGYQFKVFKVFKKRSKVDCPKI